MKKKLTKNLNKFSYEKNFDILRAISVLLVILFHLNEDLFSFGFASSHSLFCHHVRYLFFHDVILCCFFPVPVQALAFQCTSLLRKAKYHQRQQTIQDNL